jgi:hypothetical protein
VVREFASEADVSRKPLGTRGEGEGVNGQATLVDEAAPVDLSALSLDPALAKSMNRELDALGAHQYLDQLQRLERSVLRLERMNVQTLGMLKKLVSAVRKSSGEEAK